MVNDFCIPWIPNGKERTNGRVHNTRWKGSIHGLTNISLHLPIFSSLGESGILPLSVIWMVLRSNITPLCLDFSRPFCFLSSANVLKYAGMESFLKHSNAQLTFPRSYASIDSRQRISLTFTPWSCVNFSIPNALLLILHKHVDPSNWGPPTLTFVPFLKLQGQSLHLCAFKVSSKKKKPMVRMARSRKSAHPFSPQGQQTNSRMTKIAQGDDFCFIFWIPVCISEGPHIFWSGPFSAFSVIIADTSSPTIFTLLFTTCDWNQKQVQEGHFT